MRFLALTFISLISTYMQAQLFDNWHFGAGAAIFFNTGSPVSYTGSAMNTGEGCANISDQNGDILFYTNGVKVYNKNHVQMPNGMSLLGHPSSTQSGIIVPWPLNKNKYFIFTVAQQSNPDGFRYSIVDMSLDSGLGDIDTSFKNIPLFSPCSEKIAAVMHANDTSIWVMAKHYGSDAFYAYLITPQGINPPVISHSGTPVGIMIPNAATLGYMKFSNDGSRLACAHYYLNLLEIHNFNTVTGMVSNAITINYPFVPNGPYGLEFSPNGQFLYVAETHPNLYQFNLLATNISGSAVVLHATDEFNQVGALQLGPDNKIYIARPEKKYLSAINNPNNSGLGCSFTDSAVGLISGFCAFGLPPRIEGYNNVQSFDFSFTCFYDSVQFFNQTLFSDSVLWNFGDPNSGIANFSKLENPNHLFTSIGSYQVKLFVFYKNKIDTVVRTIDISSHFLWLSKSSPVCDGDSVAIWVNNYSSSDSTLWFNGSRDSLVYVKDAGVYWAQQYVSGCVVSDSIEVDFIAYPKFNLRPDTAICSHHSIILEVEASNYSVLWSTGETSNSIKVSEPGWYGVTLSNQQCSTYERMYLEVYNCAPKIEMPNIFSPNGDGFNDFFSPLKAENISEFHIQIFNRFGTLIFESVGSELNWDGHTATGNKAADGVYFWVLNYKDLDLNAFEQKGNVTLVGQ